ncbi:MAG TPA: LacI family DNA-binding transcriptional regulator [Pseudonocardiaceae bacterium]|jgi:LacI family transcriptional regulator
MSRPRVTGHDVAHAVGVSQAAVSLVFSDKWHGRLSEQTVEEIRRAADKLGYRPNLSARGLRTGATGTVLLIIPVLANPYFAYVHAAIVQEAAKHLMSVVVYPLDAADEETPFPTTRQVVDGVLGCAVDRARIHGIIDGLPLVMIDAEPAPKVRTVNADIAAGMVDAVGHLAELGHRRVAHFAASRLTWTFRQRAAAFDQAGAERGLAVDRIRLQLTMEEGYLHAAEVLSGPNRPTAIVCDNDQLAVGVFWAARKVGLDVPGDVSVVGFDDAPVGRVMSPQLTSVRIPADELGAVAMSTLERQLHGRRTHSTVLPTTLVVRGTTGPPAGPIRRGSGKL